MTKNNGREEITDLFADNAYDKIDPKTGKHVFRTGKILRFEFEGTLTTIKVTKINRIARRMWGEHIELTDPATTASHYGHFVDSSKEAMDEYGKPFCTDCGVTVDESANEDGDVKAANRRDKTLADGTVIDD